MLLGFSNSGVVAAVENDDGIACMVDWKAVKCFRDRGIGSLSSELFKLNFSSLPKYKLSVPGSSMRREVV